MLVVKAQLGNGTPFFFSAVPNSCFTWEIPTLEDLWLVQRETVWVAFDVSLIFFSEKFNYFLCWKKTHFVHIKITILILPLM